MQNYLDLVQDILDNGVEKKDRTGTGTLSVFGRQLRFNLADGRFPLVTTKQLHLKSIIHELLYFISGETNIRALREAGVTIWNPWVGEDGEAGRIYGVQWNDWRETRLVYESQLEDYEKRGFRVLSLETVENCAVMGRSINQLQVVIDQLRTDPDSRRIILSAWNVSDLDEMVLPPCHLLCQFNTVLDANGQRILSTHLNLRSSDVAIGLPYNIASYALLTAMLAQITGMVPGELIVSTGDTHLYTNLIDGVKEQLTHIPRTLPALWLNRNIQDLWEFHYSDFEITGYNPHPPIKMAVSV